MITTSNTARRVCSHVYVACRRSDRLPGGFNVPAGIQEKPFCKVIEIGKGLDEGLLKTDLINVYEQRLHRPISVEAAASRLDRESRIVTDATSNDGTGFTLSPVDLPVWPALGRRNSGH